MSSPGYVSLLRDNRPFRLLWLGTVVSFLGDWLSTVALLTIAMELSSSAQVIAAVLIAKTLPVFLVSPLTGPIADRFDRRWVLLVADGVRVVLMLGIVAAYVARNMQLILLLLVARTVMSGVFVAARSAAIPDLAAGPQLPVAMALSGGTWSVMLAVGAGLGGVLVETVGVEGSLLLDAGTFLLSAAFLWGLPPLPPRADGSGSTGFLDGMRYLRGRVYLPAVLLCKPALGLAGGSLVLLPMFGDGLFSPAAGPLYIGLLYGARGMGALVGAMGVRRVFGDRRQTLQVFLIPGYLLLGLPMALLAWAPSMGAAAALYFLGAVGNGIVWVFSGILGQLGTVREVRGRLFALEFGLTMAVSSLSSYLAGLAIDLGTDPRRVALAVGLVAATPAVAWLLVLLLAPDVERD